VVLTFRNSYAFVQSNFLGHYLLISPASAKCYKVAQNEYIFSGPTVVENLDIREFKVIISHAYK